MQVNIEEKNKLKRKIIGSIIFVLLFFLASEAYLNLYSDNITGENILEVNSFVDSPGRIKIYFCPRENCSLALVQFLDTASTSIHCAVYELDLKPVQEKLMEKAGKMEVQVVTDNDYLYEFNHSFVKIDSYGLMHDKFCVVDGKKVYMGSMNPTNNDAYKNNNNMLLIDSEILAQNYEEEFQEMWNGIFKKGNKVKNPSVMIRDIEIKNYFCPEDECAEKVKEELGKAKRSISFMAFSFTNQGIANVLLLKKLENISIQGVMEARQVTKDSVFQQLQYQGVDVIKDGNPRNMHHKVFMIDEETVVTGSFNPTGGGDSRNDENIVIIKDKDIAEKFLKEYKTVRKEGEEKLVIR